MVRSAVYLNTGTDRCLEAACLMGLSATDWTWSVRFEDLDNDGRLDLHVTNGMIRNFFDADLHARVANFPPAERSRAIKAAPVLVEKNLAFRNRGDLQFEDVSAAWGLDQAGVSFGAAFGDLDGDGDLDLVFINYEGNPIVCRNDSDHGHSIIVALHGTISNRFGAGATVQIETAAGPQVRQLVLARGYMSSSEPVLHFGLGDEGVVKQLTVKWPSGQDQSFENLAADRRYTITEVANGAEQPSKSEAPKDHGQFEEVSQRMGLALTTKDARVDELKGQPLLPFRQNPFGPGVAIGDLDGDGRDDIVVGGMTGQPTQIALCRGNEAYHAQFISANPEGAADAAPLVFDADGDGRNDLLLPKGGVAHPAGDAAYQPMLYVSRGDKRFHEAPPGALPAFTSSAGPCVAADFDRDGRLDIFIGGRVVPGAYGAIPRSALWMNRGDHFSDETESLAAGLTRAGMVAAVLATDVDQDGWMDLLVALQWGEIQCWRNLTGKGFENRSERFGFSSAGSGWWNSLAAADFNGDGRLDYVVGNVGLNTPYHATPQQPALLYRGDFDSSGQQQLIEASPDGSVFVPRRGRSTMIAAMPSLARKFPTFAGYAKATVEDIFGEEPLRQAARLQATEFRSGVFLSQPDGTFRFTPLPRLAQIAPIYGLVAADFDGDGRADICAVQNSYAPISETGRFDGGLGQVFRGDGHGGFIPVPARESRLIVPGDGKGLACLDVDGDGWPDLIVTRNNSTVLVFRNSGQPGRNSFAVTLEGSPANRQAIGARIEIVMEYGGQQTAEVSAGGGYLSQSSATCFFGFEQSNAPREIRIAWPSGAHSSHPWAAGTSRFRFTVPTP